jgi:3-deoxy-D-manno-octulosonate 8-phosphate phosphatase (KDO 8-P phosphatase)
MIYLLQKLFNRLTILNKTLQTNFLEEFPQALERAQEVKLLVLDVDGVLTDGSLFISPDGVEHLKVFNSLDGHGIKLLKSAGIEIAIITGRNSPMVKMRAQALGIEHLYMGVDEKASALKELLKKLNLHPSNCAAIGDDWPDLSILTKVRLALAPANAHQEVKAVSHYVCHFSGGHGAVREVCDLILSAQDHYQKLLLLAKE